MNPRKVGTVGSWIEQPVTLGSSGPTSVAIDVEYKEGHRWIEGSRTFLSFLSSVVSHSPCPRYLLPKSVGFSGAHSPALPIVLLRPRV